MINALNTTVFKWELREFTVICPHFPFFVFRQIPMHAHTHTYTHSCVFTHYGPLQFSAERARAKDERVQVLHYEAIMNRLTVRLSKFSAPVMDNFSSPALEVHRKVGSEV